MKYYKPMPMKVINAAALEYGGRFKTTPPLYYILFPDGDEAEAHEMYDAGQSFVGYRGVRSFCETVEMCGIATAEQVYARLLELRETLGGDYIRTDFKAGHPLNKEDSAALYYALRIIAEAVNDQILIGYFDQRINDPHILWVELTVLNHVPVYYPELTLESVPMTRYAPLTETLMNKIARDINKTLDYLEERNSVAYGAIC